MKNILNRDSRIKDVLNVLQDALLEASSNEVINGYEGSITHTELSCLINKIED